ncbi:MAG TPA: GWxTD domain-containing protein, partial [Thermoanaerobaculia bacterium]|nr:GWxTD domain-containing protein [Thermoanaerobaculia bacterium]
MPRRPLVVVVPAVLAAFVGLSAVLSPARAQDDTPSRRQLERQHRDALAALPEKYRQWVAEVHPILTPDEKASFLALAKDYQRDAFIKRFWEARDPYPRTARNEFKMEWEAKVQVAHERYEDLYDARARLLLLNGVPAEVAESDCPSVFVPLEVWYWPRAERTGSELLVVLYRPFAAGPFRLWHPMDTMEALRPPAGRVDTGGGYCKDPQHHGKIMYGIGWISRQGMLAWEMLQARFDSPPDPPGQEWIAAFSSYSTDLPEGAAPLAARLAFDFPGRNMSRTVVQGVVTVAPTDAGQAQVAEARSYNFLLTGEVLANGELFDSFRYKFDLPTGEESLPLAFQRSLRPGDYTVIVKLEDVNSGKVFRDERTLTVPAIEKQAVASVPSDPESARLLAEANAAVGNRDVTLQIAQPLAGNEMQTGMERFDVLVTGDGIAAVHFSLNG